MSVSRGSLLHAGLFRLLRPRAFGLYHSGSAAVFACAAARYLVVRVMDANRAPDAADIVESHYPDKPVVGIGAGLLPVSSAGGARLHQARSAPSRRRGFPIPSLILLGPCCWGLRG